MTPRLLTRGEQEVCVAALAAIRQRIEARTLDMTKWGEVVLLDDVKDVINDAIASVELAQTTGEDHA